MLPTSSTASLLLYLAGFRFALVIGTPLCKFLHQVPLCLGQIKPVQSLGETQVGVDTGNDNACIYREQFNADKDTRT